MRTISFEGALQEVCKYVTKMSSFFEVPASDPAAIKAIRGKRLIDRLRELRCLSSRQTGGPRRTYLDTHATSDGMGYTGRRGVLPLRDATRRTLRQIGAEMIAAGKRSEWLEFLHRKNSRRQVFRRRQLSTNHPHATFCTLAGQVWYGKHVAETVLEAPECVQVFASVGVKNFSVTMVRDSNPIGRRGELYEPRLSERELCRKLPYYIQRNLTKSESLIIRPLEDYLIQVDDVTADSLERIGPYTFLVTETSPNNYQAYFALPQNTSKLERDRIRSRLLSVLPGADRNASGAMRVPGSINHKPGRDEFSVRIVESNSGRCVTIDELETAGLLSSESRVVNKSRTRLSVAGTSSKTLFTFPDYERCLSEAPRKQDGSADRSIADKDWAILALGRGIPSYVVEAQLINLSDKARSRREYAHRTVEYAVSVVSRNYLPRSLREVLNL